MQLKREIVVEETTIVKTEALVSPGQILSTSEGVVVTAAALLDVAADAEELDDVVVEEEADSDDNKPHTVATTANQFLAELKEEVILQTILYKKINDNETKRVFELKHANGRKLLVIMPPNSQSAQGFEEDARRTHWIDELYCFPRSAFRVCFVIWPKHTRPSMYVSIGRQRQLSMRVVALTTAQTMALAIVGNLNDTRLKKVKSFLRHVANVNLVMSAKEKMKIDIQVGLERTSQVLWGEYVHEWALTKGKENKPPGLVHFWNSSLANEIEAQRWISTFNICSATTTTSSQNCRTLITRLWVLKNQE